jgi:hypothetical protein
LSWAQGRWCQAKRCKRRATIEYDVDIEPAKNARAHNIMILMTALP